MSDNQHEEANAGQMVRPHRIDGPHSVGSLKSEQSPALVAELAAVGAGAATEYLVDWPGEPAASLEGLLELDETLKAREEQLENQAAQLASHLQEQLRDLEHREALQNARAAELDNELRRDRLWITEKSAELSERETAVAAAEAKLAADREEAQRQLALKEQCSSQEASQKLQQSETRHHEIEARQAVLVKSEQELAQRQQLVGEREANLAERERQHEAKEYHLRERRQFIEREAAALHHSRQEWERLQQGEQTVLTQERTTLREELEKELSQREKTLSDGESLLAEHTHKLERDEQTLARERADWQRQRAADREAISFQRHRAEAELEQRRTRLAAREQALDKQQAALDQLRSEITSAHRQSIEMRMIAEQLWGQVQGRIPPAEVTQALAQLRLKLSEQYRLEQHGLTQQKEELLSLAEKVAEQSATLRGQRQELQTWFTAREEEIERQAESLVSREQELQDLSDQLGQSATRWQTDRRQLEQQLREAQGRLRAVAA